MSKQVMRRTAADNVYLHKDFHGALSGGIEYLHKQCGAAAVREYLHDFARAYYAPLTRRLTQEGLSALREYFERIYADEGVAVDIVLTESEMVLKVPRCPAVTHMRAHDYPVARLFRETTATVNAAICEGTPFAAELVEYDEKTGRSVQRFYRRNA